MKKLFVILLISSAIAVVAGCSDVRRDRGREYMPDMAYSRAYETYEPHENLTSKDIHYDATPVVGTMKRGEIVPYPIAADKEGDSTNYVASRQVPNPFASISKDQMKEAERLYLINCAICHGTNLDGNGPLYNDGKGPYPAAPKNLIADAVVKVMPEGQLFYSVTYGKGSMGPYASNLRTEQRWMVVRYVKMKQLESAGGAKSDSTTSSDGQSGGQTGGNQSSGGQSMGTGAAKPGKTSGADRSATGKN